MTDRAERPATSRFPRTSDGPARNLRDKLAALRAQTGIGTRAERLQFRSLKRLALPRHNLSQGLAPNL